MALRAAVPGDTNAIYTQYPALDGSSAVWHYMQHCNSNNTSYLEFETNLIVYLQPFNVFWKIIYCRFFYYSTYGRQADKNVVLKMISGCSLENSIASACSLRNSVNIRFSHEAIANWKVTGNWNSLSIDLINCQIKAKAVSETAADCVSIPLLERGHRTQSSQMEDGSGAAEEVGIRTLEPRRGEDLGGLYTVWCSISQLSIPARKCRGKGHGISKL